MGDWRLARLAAIAELDGRMVPPARDPFWASVAKSAMPFYYIVSRPGVPDWDARVSSHFTRRRAERVAARWNARLAALAEGVTPPPED